MNNLLFKSLIKTAVLLLTFVFSSSAQEMCTNRIPFHSWKGPEIGDTIIVSPGENLWRIETQTLYELTRVEIKFRGRTGANTFELEILKKTNDPGRLGRPLLDYDNSTRAYYLSPNETLVIFPESSRFTVSFKAIDLRGSSLRFIVSTHPKAVVCTLGGH